VFWTCRGFSFHCFLNKTDWWLFMRHFLGTGDVSHPAMAPRTQEVMPRLCANVMHCVWGTW
jgi:hypothetical protein